MTKYQNRSCHACGSDMIMEELGEVDDDGDPIYRVHCYDCGWSTVQYYTIESARFAWSRNWCTRRVSEGEKVRRATALRLKVALIATLIFLAMAVAVVVAPFIVAAPSSPTTMEKTAHE